MMFILLCSPELGWVLLSLDFSVALYAGATAAYAGAAAYAGVTATYAYA
jgi:hypothetical protein